MLDPFISQLCTDFITFGSTFVSLLASIFVKTLWSVLRRLIGRNSSHVGTTFSGTLLMRRVAPTVLEGTSRKSLSCELNTSTRIGAREDLHFLYSSYVIPSRPGDLGHL